MEKIICQLKYIVPNTVENSKFITIIPSSRALYRN